MVIAFDSWFPSSESKLGSRSLSWLLGLHCSSLFSRYHDEFGEEKLAKKLEWLDMITHWFLTLKKTCSRWTWGEGLGRVIFYNCDWWRLVEIGWLILIGCNVILNPGHSQLVITIYAVCVECWEITLTSYIRQKYCKNKKKNKCEITANKVKFRVDHRSRRLMWGREK